MANFVVIIPDKGKRPRKGKKTYYDATLEQIEGLVRPFSDGAERLKNFLVTNDREIDFYAGGSHLIFTIAKMKTLE